MMLAAEHNATAKIIENYTDTLAQTLEARGGHGLLRGLNAGPSSTFLSMAFTAMQLVASV
jgi:hypothetical protein